MVVQYSYSLKILFILCQAESLKSLMAQDTVSTIVLEFNSPKELIDELMRLIEDNRRTINEIKRR